MKTRLATIGLLTTLWAAPALGQGCAMCYSNAAGTTILVLLVPPVGFMTVGMGLAFHYGKKRDEAAESSQEK